MDILILVIGFIFLIKGADLFVEGAAGLAKKFKVPAMIIGLTIVAMGTSAPEAAVSITSALQQQNELSVANVVGSNFFNVLVVLGACAIITPLPINKNTIKKDMPILIGSSLVLLLMAFDLFISRIEGIILLVLFISFIIYTIRSARNDSSYEVDLSEIPQEDMKALNIIFYCTIGLLGILLGGNLVVESATNIATQFGMSANLVGLTIVAVGTSLPELITSLVATRKGETELAVGNVIGSNVFNILLIIGLSGTISPLAFASVAFIDIIFMLVITGLLLWIIKKGSITKKDGYFMIAIYAIYMLYTIIR